MYKRHLLAQLETIRRQGDEWESDAQSRWELMEAWMARQEVRGELRNIQKPVLHDTQQLLTTMNKAKDAALYDLRLRSSSLNSSAASKSASRKLRRWGGLRTFKSSS
jgi:hypothetical protein